MGSAKLADADDALRADQERPFALDVRPSPAYLLVSREDAKPAATSSHFVERALAPVIGKQGRRTARVTRVPAARLDRDSVAGSELVVLDHPGKLAQGSAALLADLMRRGRSVLYVASEPADATNLRLIADAAGQDLKLPVEFLPPSAGQPRRGLFLADVRRNEAPFSVFGDAISAATGPLRFAGGLASRRNERGLADDVLATFSDRSAALVVSRCGAGSLGVLNADLSASTLPNSPAFVPLVGELVGRLLGTRSDRGPVNSGEPMAAYLPSEAGGAAGLAFDPAGENGQLAEENGAVTWRWNSAGAPGVYRVVRGDATVYAVAPGVAGEESDLRTIDPGVIPRLAGGRQVHFDAAGGGEDDDRKDRAWSWALVACAVCMIVEIGVLKAFAT